MNGKKETMDVRDAVAVEDAIKSVASSKWASWLISDPIELRAIATYIVQELDRSRAERKP